MFMKVCYGFLHNLNRNLILNLYDGNNLYKSSSSEEMKQTPPLHVAFIVDGNGRWAEARGLSRAKGHNVGANVTVEIVQSCYEKGVEIVTLYLFSSENWKRPSKEV